MNDKKTIETIVHDDKRSPETIAHDEKIAKETMESYQEMTIGGYQEVMMKEYGNKMRKMILQKEDEKFRDFLIGIYNNMLTKSFWKNSKKINKQDIINYFINIIQNNKEEKDQKAALKLYKSDEKNIDKLKDAKYMIERHSPFTSDNYETIGLYASITRKISEIENTKENIEVAYKIAKYFVSKFTDAYSISTSYMLFIAEYDNSIIDYEDLEHEFKKLKVIADGVKDSEDTYLYDTKKTIDYFLGLCEEPVFDHPESSQPVLDTLKQIKKLRNEA